MNSGLVFMVIYLAHLFIARGELFTSGKEFQYGDKIYQCKEVSVK